MTISATSKGAKLYVNTASSGSTPTWVQIKQLSKYPQVGEGSLAKLETTNLDCTTMRTYCKDLADAPDLTFEFVAMPVSAQDSNTKLLATTLNPENTYGWKLEVPEIGLQATFDGQWTWHLAEGGNSTVANLVLEIAGTTAITIAEYTPASQ